MKIYNYDKFTNEYISQDNAELDVIATRREGKEVYFLPAYSTFDEPPIAQTNKVAVYVNGWEIKDDFRGMYKVNENMQPEKITAIGSLPVGYIAITEEQANKIIEDDLYYVFTPEGLIVNPQYAEKTLERAKQNKYTENDNKASEARYNQEFTITIQDKECVFDTKSTTQADLLTAFAVCSSGATYDSWVTNNGVELDLTLEDVTLISQVFKEKSNVYGKWNEYKQEIDSAVNVEEVNNIVIDYEVE